jgi:hypothetical protein
MLPGEAAFRADDGRAVGREVRGDLVLLGRGPAGRRGPGPLLERT